MLLLTEGCSHPGGLENGHFSWMALPAATAEIDRHLHLALSMDERDRKAIIGWGEDGPGLSAPPGANAFLLDGEDASISHQALGKLAAEIAKNPGRATHQLHVATAGDVERAVRSILVQANSRRP